MEPLKAGDCEKQMSSACRYAVSTLGKIIKNGRLTLDAGNGVSITLGKEHPEYPDVTITAPTRIHLMLMASMPDPYFLNGYVHGWWEVRDGELEDVLRLLSLNLQTISVSIYRKIGEKIREGLLHLCFLMKQRVNLKRNRRFVSHHYDIGDDLYHRFLDPEHLLYSCAFFDDGITALDAAQNRKLEVTMRRLDVPDNARVLDIGCGWGGVTRYIGRHIPAAHIAGITLSQNQYDYAERARLALPEELSARLRYELCDYREHRPQKTYDRIVSIGMFEHVGFFQYDAYFSAVARLLNTEGRAVIHTIVRPEPGRCSIWVDHNIFPGGYIPSIAETQRAIEKNRLLVENIHCHAGLNYRKTLLAWRENYRKAREQLPADKYDAQFHRMWEMYFASSIYTFDADLDAYQVAQFVLRKRR